MGGIDFTVYKGSSPDGTIVEARGHRDGLGPTEALVKITHSGVCGTDEHVRTRDQGLGHEGVGIIQELGPAVPPEVNLKVGDRVGMGLLQRFCGYCTPCLKGLQMKCEHSQIFPRDNRDQGCFGTAAVWDVSTLIKIPHEIASEDAGPLMCGGMTVWGPLYEHGMRAGDRIGIVGFGGLGHLAIQFVAKMGMEAVVFSRTDSKKAEAFGFGASEFHATKGVKDFKGVKPIDHLLITTSVLPDLALYTSVLNPFAKIFPLTLTYEPWPIPIVPLLTRGYQIVGSSCAHAHSAQQMMVFAAKHGVRPQIEKFPMTLNGVTDAFEKLQAGKLRYRAVLVAE